MVKKRGASVAKLIYGADTETCKGKPMTLQFYSEDTACDEIYFVDERTAESTFLKWCATRQRDVQHVVYIHFLSFDLIELFWKNHARLVTGSGDFDFQVGKWHVSGVYGTPTFCRVTDGHSLTVTLVDSYSYFRENLASAAERVCPDLPKLRRPAGLGDKLFTRRDSGFIDYARRDAVVAYHLGRAVEAMHVEFDVAQCVSAAHLAASVFRRKFLTYTIPQPNRVIVDRALLSYHGGKNNCTVPAGWYEGVASLDISSAYPDAMRQLPAFSNAKLYKKFNGGRVSSVPDLGVYQIAGRVADCQWPVIFSHGFKPLSGVIDGVWVQGYEVNEALRSGELKPTRVRGFYYDAERDHQAPALRHYVDTFYEKKENAKNPTLRHLYKVGFLNSISGKFIQTRKRNSCVYTDVDAGVTVNASELIAGGLFHPFIASAITAHTRARIHRLEHSYSAIHTATDGIMAQRANVKGSGSGIGALTVEARDATLLLLRNKCYVLYGRKSAKTKPSRVFKGRHILKFALHGFQGSVSDLERLAGSGRRTYTVNRPNRLKESIKRGLTPNLFVKRQHVLKVGPLPVFKSRGRVSPPIVLATPAKNRRRVRRLPEALHSALAGSRHRRPTLRPQRQLSLRS